MPQQVQFPLITWITTKLIRSYYGVPNDGGTNNIRRVEIIDGDQFETSNVHLGHAKKRRKVQTFLCFKLEYVNTIISWLRDDNVTTIGINGMGGVGKTTLAIELYNRVLLHDMLAAWVSVGVDFTMYQLQKEISSSLGVDLEGDKDEIRRAGRLNAFLSRNKKCVIFLDDLWGYFRREDVGIPRNCKIVLVSRLLDVCRVLRCEKVLKVQPLSEEESWELFQHCIGCDVVKNEVVPWIRERVFNKCEGLPLAVTELANSLRKIIDDSGSSWKEVLDSMDQISVGAVHFEETFNQLKKSYDRLNDVLQRCFLYCALYPKGYAISREKLIHLWIGERLIGYVESLQAQYDMGHSILNKLLNSSLLLETNQDEKTVRMHNFVRHMALSIAKDNFMVKTSISSNLEFCENLHVVSCIKSSISLTQLSTPLKCSNLSTLLLQHNPFEIIPDQFFLHMCSLRVLNLSDTCISRLPSSIAALEELRVLDLSFCQNLKKVSLLAKLVKLQFLDISHTAITKVPSALGKLKKLRELNLSCLPEQTRIPSEVLVSSFRLKRLVCYLEGTIHELQNVKSLEILEVRFSSLCELGNYIRSKHWSTLESYHLQVGGELGSQLPHSKRVVLQSCSLTQGDKIMLPGNILELNVVDCRGFCSLSDVVNFVADSNKNNKNFASIDSCNGEQKFNDQVEKFSSLEICSVSRCHEIETLFAPSWMENLQSLQTLRVEDCGQLKEIIQEGNRSVISIPQLRRLALIQLPQMNSIYKGRLVCASLQSCTVIDCPKLNRLPFIWMDAREKSLPSCLEWIEGHEKWWEMLEWDQPESKGLLKPLFRCKSFPDH